MKFFDALAGLFRGSKRITVSSFLLPKTFVITFNGNSYTILRSDPGFDELYRAYKSNNFLEVEKFLKQNGYLKDIIALVNEDLKQMQIEQAQNDPASEEVEEEEVEEEFDPPSDNTPTTTKNQEVLRPATKKPATRTEKFLTLDVSDDGAMIINGVKFDNSLTEKIAQLYYQGHDIKSYYELLRKIAENSSEVIRSGLLDFILVNDLPITTDGCFLAYKVVGDDGYDLHSHTIKYEVGVEVKEDRNLVSKDRGECSGKGLYFASRNYYSECGGYNRSSYRRFLVKVDPADVVSIPYTYQHSKGRCCRYIPVMEIGWDPSNIPDHKGIVDINTLKGIKTSGTREIPGLPEVVREGTQDNIEKPDVPVLKDDKLYAKKDSQGRYRTLKGHFIKAEDLHLFTILNSEVKPIARKDRNGKYRNAKGHFIKAEDLEKYTLED
jgi:hypothetical protein